MPIDVTKLVLHDWWNMTEDRAGAAYQLAGCAREAGFHAGKAQAHAAAAGDGAASS